MPRWLMPLRSLIGKEKKPRWAARGRPSRGFGGAWPARDDGQNEGVARGYERRERRPRRPTLNPRMLPVRLPER